MSRERVVVLHAREDVEPATALAQALLAAGILVEVTADLDRAFAEPARRVLFCATPSLEGALARANTGQKQLHRLAALRPGKILVAVFQRASPALRAVKPFSGKRRYAPDEIDALVRSIQATDADRCTPEELAHLLGAARNDQADLVAVVRDLQSRRQFGAARHLLDALAPFGWVDVATRTLLIQQQALCVYKDPDLPRHAAFKRAARLLEAIEHHPTAASEAETRTLQGAIYKRRWQVFGNIIDLQRSLRSYAAAAKHADEGYAEINQAFLLDALAYVEEINAGPAAPTADARRYRQEAIAIREKIVALLDTEEKRIQRSGNWWYRATLAEAYFGLDRFEEATREIGEALATAAPDPWRLESTARQLAALALYRNPGRSFDDLDAKGALAVLAALDIGESAVTTAVVGKLGLALSGGGFRASLFHIGVLARLAELDVLRHVEVISCVSGGSIIGAYYYLALKALLEQRDDSSLAQEDYLIVVEKVSANFLAGVQRNLRVQVIADSKKNLDMLERDDYTRTHRLAELYDEHLYARVARAGLRMSDLKIQPAAEETFEPKYDNWRRRHKVPALVLNAATLNTGHAWQFTATYMGEPPSHIDDDVDVNARLRRVYYEQAPPPHGDLPLRHAVAASSCVPGLFAPLRLAGLYPKQTALLVDGGVHDNQGTASLLEQDCTVVLVSDGSQQLGSETAPSDGAVPVLLRTNSVFQTRVRTAQFRELDARRLVGVLRGLMYVHLKNGLGELPVSWIGCDEPRPAPGDAQDTKHDKKNTSYDMDSEVQAALASLRTDLDSFSDIEAYGLMLSGYRMTKECFRVRPDLAIVPQLECVWRWKFSEAAALLDAPRTDQARAEALDRLRLGENTILKGWRTVVPPWITNALLALCGIPLCIWLLAANPEVVSIGGRALVISVLMAAARYAFKLDLGQLRPEEALRGRVRRYLAAPILAAIAKLHLRYFEPKVLARGKIEAIQRVGSQRN